MENNFSSSIRKILLADDSITIQKVVNLTFADEGVDVITVSDGDTAMEKFAEEKPDLVLADINMPGLDGYRICEKIKQNSETKGIPVILLVGSFEPFSEEEARRVGADDFLTKPFQSIRQLVNKVSDLLDSKTEEEVFASLDTGAPTPVNSFEDTLKMHQPDMPEDDFGDAGMDDEMIQTAQVGSLPIDEAKKFESAPVDESLLEEVDFNALKQPYNSPAPSANFENETDWAKTQPLSKKDLEEIPDVLPNAEAEGFEEKNNADFSNQDETLNEFSQPAIASDLDFDDFNLLDFPQPERQGNFSSDSEFTGKESEADSAKPIENLSPAMIDAIADKVVEKLSGKVIKKIVREVVAQMEKKK